MRLLLPDPFPRCRPIEHAFARGLTMSYNPPSAMSSWARAVVFSSCVVAMAACTSTMTPRVAAPSQDRCARSYRPACLGSNDTCTVDQNGCTVCTCTIGLERERPPRAVTPAFDFPPGSSGQ